MILWDIISPLNIKEYKPIDQDNFLSQLREGTCLVLEDKNKKPSQKQGKDWWLPGADGEIWEKWVKVVKKYKHPLIG